MTDDPEAPRYATEATAMVRSIRAEVIPLLAGDVDSMIALAADVEDVVEAWADLLGDVKGLVLANLPPLRRDELYEPEGVPEVIGVQPRPGNTQRVYDNDRLRAVLAAALPIMVNADGEDVRAWAVDTMAKITGAMAPSFSYWRITALRELGVDAYRFVVDEKSGRAGLKIVRRKPEQPTPPTEDVAE